MINVISFDSSVHSLEDLNQMSVSEKIELAIQCRMLGDDDVYMCSISEFQEFYNTGMADPEVSYIFFVEVDD